MQMNEVKSGWKHSTDPASKARVREALNAGLSAMPGKLFLALSYLRASLCVSHGLTRLDLDRV